MAPWIPRLALAVTLATTSLTATPSDAALVQTNLPVQRLVSGTFLADGVVYVALDEVMQAARCTLTPQEAGYEAWPCRAGGIVAVDAAALDGYVAPKKEGNSLGSDGDTRGFNPQPDPPRTLRIRGTLISANVRVDSEGRSYVPLAHVVAAMGGRLRKTRRGFEISIPSRRLHAPLRVEPATL